MEISLQSRAIDAWPREHPLKQFLFEITRKKTASPLSRRLAVRSTLVLAGTMAAALSNAQVIEQCTERALPGEPINITADGITGSVSVKIGLVGTNGQVSTWDTCTILGQDANVVQAQVPSILPSGLWAVEVVTSKGTSAPAYINRAEVYFLDSTQSSPGASLNVYGRNLEVLGTSVVGSVQFVPTSGPTLSGTITKATPFNYVVTVPAAAKTGMTYTVNVSNGFGGAAGEVAAPTQLPIVAPAADPFGVGLWWGRQFTFSGNVYNIQSDPRLSAHANGQGRTEDEATVQAAINTASKAGGGVIYFPAGVYRVGGTSTLSLQSNVVLAGAGPSVTTLEYGYNYTANNPPSGTWAIGAVNKTLMGFYNLTIQNLSTSSTETHGIELGYPVAGPVDRVFFNNCYLLLGNDVGLTSCNSTNVAIENCKIQSLSTNYSPLGLQADMHLTLANNMLVYRNGRLQLSKTDDAVVTGNTFSRDNTYMTANCTETGGIELSGARDAFVYNNVIQGIGPFPVKTGCGEMINAQIGGLTNYLNVGSVTSSTSMTLTNAAADWPSTFTPANSFLFNPAFVAIIKGTGMGQVRTISSNTSTTLTVSQAWNVNPDSTSVYVIGVWAADHLLILNNTESNSNYGVEFWNGAYDCVADSNTVTNCGGIMLRSADVTDGSGYHEHDLCWGDWISNNTLTNTSGNVPANLVAYSVNGFGVVYGSSLLDPEFRSNTLNAHSPNTILSEQWGSSEALYASIVTYDNGPTTAISNLGLRVLYTKTSNIAKPIQISAAGLSQVLSATPINP